MTSFTLKRTAIAVLVALSAGTALAADLTVETGVTREDSAPASYESLTVNGTYTNAANNNVSADSVVSSGTFTNNGTFTAGTFEVTGGKFANSGTLNTETFSLSAPIGTEFGGQITASESITIF